MKPLVESTKNFSSHKSDAPPNLSIVFSMRNEELVLGMLIARIRKVLNPLQEEGILSDYELIFVNDASTDGSLQVILENAAGQDDIRVINMSRRFGVSPCVMAGFSYARGDMVVYMDADLQDPPELIPKLIEVTQKEKADVVHTIRDTRKGESKFKLCLTGFGYWLLNKISNINLPRESGDFKLLSRRAIDHVLRLQEHRPFMRGLICWIGFKQAFVPYTREPRYQGQTKFFILGRDVVSNFLDSALISFSSAPLKLAYVFGVMAIFLDFLLVLHVYIQKLLGTAVPGWTAIMMTILFFSGIQLFCMGIMGLYLYSIYEQSKQRPNYIVESTFGFPDHLPSSHLNVDDYHRKSAL